MGKEVARDEVKGRAVSAIANYTLGVRRRRNQQNIPTQRPSKLN
jgi:hypothetical protein